MGGGTRNFSKKQNSSSTEFCKFNRNFAGCSDLLFNSSGIHSYKLRSHWKSNLLSHKTILIASVSLASIAASSIIIFFSLLRFRLIEKHPYLISLPVFTILLKNLPKEQLESAINEIFEMTF